MKKIVVLGAGLIGKTIAAELSKSFEVTCVDRDSLRLSALASAVTTVQMDLREADGLNRVVQDCDLVVGAVPGFMGFQTMKTVIMAGKNIVDISFFPEDPFPLHNLAIDNNVMAVFDAGVAPGLCNVWAGFENARTPLHYYECLVGGLPTIRQWPYEYKAGFSPADVLEEYTRPARLVENGKYVTREALSEMELIWFEGVGTLEAFNTDGLRSLLVTMPGIPNMKEKTMRWPGHAMLMRVLRETGLLSRNEVDVGGQSVRPIDLTSKLLFPLWEMKNGEKDVTVMRVTTESTAARIVYELMDVGKDDVTAMGRTTGYTCTGLVHLILDGTIMSTPGLIPPEVIGAQLASLEPLQNYLAGHGIEWRKTETPFA